MSRKEELLSLATDQEAKVRQARLRLEDSIDARNTTVAQLRTDGASYGEIAKALGLTRAGAVGICRKIERPQR